MLLVAFVVSAVPAHADLGGFYYKKIHVDAKVHKDNTWEIEETIVIDFTEPRHGFYRFIPRQFTLYHDVASPDGTPQPEGKRIVKPFLYKNKVVVKDYSEYNTSLIQYNDKDVLIRLGTWERTHTGLTTYYIMYTYQYADDRCPGYDYIHHSILGKNFTQLVEDFSFSVKFEKPLPDDISSRLKVFAGEYGKTDGLPDTLTVVATPTEIKGEARHIPAYHGLTLYALLPPGYYEDTLAVDHTVAYVSLAIFFLTALLLLVFIVVTRNPAVTKVPECYPPEGLSSAEVGTILDTVVDNVDISSLIPWFIDKGYIKAEEEKDETEEEKDEKEEAEVIIKLKYTKLRDLPDDAPDYQKIMMRYLLNRDSLYVQGENVIDIISYVASKIYDSFVGDRKLKEIKPWIWLYIPLILSATIALLLNSSVATVNKPTFFSALAFYALPISLAAWQRKTAFPYDVDHTFVHRIPAIIYKVLLAGAGFAAYHYFATDYSSPFDVWLVALLYAIPLSLIEMMGRASVITQYRADMMGHLLGFREFLQTADKDKLEQMQAADPGYISKVLPYAVVFGLTDEWSDWLQNITPEQPSWIDAETALAVMSQLRDYARVFSNFSNESHSSGFSLSFDRDSSSYGGGDDGGGGGGGGGGSW